MKIKNISILPIFDSRGNSTIEVALATPAGHEFRAAAPAGKSTGATEVVSLPFAAVRKNAPRVMRALRGRNFSTIRSLDKHLLAHDGTPNKKRLGGNFILGVSAAFARALAWERKQEVWQLLAREFFPKKGGLSKMVLPWVFSNVINGGQHAQNSLDIQEFMVVLKTRRPVADSVSKLIEFYHGLGAVLGRANGTRRLPIGDEGGYNLDFSDNFAPLRLLRRLIVSQKKQKLLVTAIDAAATSFQAADGYRFGGRIVSREHLVALYARYARSDKLLVSLEDPFAENDRAGFGLLRSALPDRLIVADDLTTTSPKLIAAAADERLANAVIIKPNQIGSVSETCDAILTAKAKGFKTIISHRSGETEDNFLICVARASNADGVKIGAPTKERLLKFNELIRLYGDD